MQTLNCSQVWGGNDKVDTEISTGALVASLYSNGLNAERGGDVYYFSVCGKDQLTRIALADVVGHGDSVSETGNWLYRSMLAHMNEPDGSVILRELNKQARERGNDAISTAEVVTIHKGLSRLYFSSAGHPPFLLKGRDENRWKTVSFNQPSRSANLPLGVFEDTPYDMEFTPLQSGDMAFLYTDGVIETPGDQGQPFGLDRLKSLLTLKDNPSPSALKSLVLQNLLDYSGGSFRHDDVTFLALQVR